MSVVVADSSPLNYLVLCDVIDVLPQLYGQIVIPQAVFTELTHAGAPIAVRQWIESRAAWTVVRSPSSVDEHLLLGRGEVEAICLAQEIHADEILMDERRGRNAALERGLRVTGTLGVLEAAAARNLFHLPGVIKKLESTNFRAGAPLLRELLKRDARRRAATDIARNSQRPPPDAKEPGGK